MFSVAPLPFGSVEVWFALDGVDGDEEDEVDDDDEVDDSLTDCGCGKFSRNASK